MDAALCGGGVPNQGIPDSGVPISAGAVQMVAAAIFMGDPLYVAGLPYEVGTCNAGGVRNSHFSSPFHAFSAFARGLSMWVKYWFRFSLTRAFCVIFLVRRSPSWILLPIGRQDPVVLRCGRSLLLQRQRRQHSPGIRERVRPGRPGFRPEQAGLELASSSTPASLWKDKRADGKVRDLPPLASAMFMACLYIVEMRKRS